MDKEYSLTPSIEDYLKTIFLLDQGEGVRSVDVAKQLKVAKPSVNHAVNTLVNNGMATQMKYGHIFLTETGLAFAKRIYEHHSRLKTFLVSVLKIDPEQAEEEACSIEHVLSDDTIERIHQLTNSITKGQ